MGLGNVWAVFCFEWKRALTVPRVLWWIVLTLFPVLIVSLVRFAPGQPPPREAWAVLLFALVPMLVSMLGTFLWATPAVSMELEQQSWNYLATRPNGSTAVILGKYLTAVTWALPAALVGLVIAVAIWSADDMASAPMHEKAAIAAKASNQVGVDSEAERQMAEAARARLKAKWLVGARIALLTCLSCPAYAAVYLVIGVLFPRRSMVFAVAYTLIFEFIISFVPAMINTLTVQYRLRALLIDWVHIPIGDRQQFGAMVLAGNSPAWLHVTLLIAYTLALLLAAVVIVRLSEFSTADEAKI